MIQTKISGLERLKGLGSGSDDLFDRVRMEKLGQFARNQVVNRTRKGIGSDDAPMTPLAAGSQHRVNAERAGKVVRIRAGYAAWKANKGLNPFRDLWGTGAQGGHMLDNLTVRSASANSVRIAFTSQKQRQKAIGNERRTPFCSFSDSDIAAIRKQAEAMFHEAVQAIGSNWPAIIRKFRGKRAA